MKFCTLFGIILLLTGCNDSSDDSDLNYLAGSIVQLDSTQNINQSIDLLLYFPSSEVSNITWQQTEGPEVDILANTSKAISFTPESSGLYSFQVTFTQSNGFEKRLTHSLSVDDKTNQLTARLSHVSAPENKVSFRAALDNVIDSDTLEWQQVSGPTISLQEVDDETAPNKQRAIFFDAPQVNQDTIITFRATAKNFADVEYSDTVAVLIEAKSTINDNAYFSDRVADVFVYNPDSPYKNNLIDCVYSNSLTSSCTLSKVPLIAAEVSDSLSSPSIESIMDRVVVSHQWMGDRFKAFLQEYDQHSDIKNLLRATTAIVISYDIRPSFYWAATGAIYLDAENFWLTANERDTINEAPDYRSDFGDDLQFVMPWRYVKDNSYASKSFSILNRESRTSEDALYRLQSLLYHELAHANDFFPSNEWYSHNSNMRILDAVLSSSFESDALDASYPLNSQEMYGLAQVRFGGETANNTQLSYLPSDIADFFSHDSASAFYAYSSIREDFAMLFEELMMQTRSGLSRDIAVTNQPSGEYISAYDYFVTWGQRGRIADDKLRDRVLFTAKRVLPEFDSESAINQLPTPIQMTTGDNWVENLTISPEASTTSSLAKSLDAFTVNSNDLDNTGSAQNNSAKGETITVPTENWFGYHHKALPTH